MGQGRGVDEALRSRMSSELRGIETALHGELRALAAMAPAAAAAGEGQ
jgi:hypothetical protein